MRVSFRVVLLGIGIVFTSSSLLAQGGGYVVSKKGSKCVTRRQAGGTTRLVGVACLTDPMNQKVVLNANSGAFTIQANCLQRDGWNVVLVACTGAENQKWILNSGSHEITPQVDPGACLELAGSGDDWKRGGDQAIGLHPCHGGTNQKWFQGKEKPGAVPPARVGKSIGTDVLHTLEGGEIISGFSSYLEIKED